MKGNSWRVRVPAVSTHGTLDKVLSGRDFFNRQDVHWYLVALQFENCVYQLRAVSDNILVIEPQKSLT